MEDDTYSISSSVIVVVLFPSKSLILFLSKKKTSKDIVMCNCVTSLFHVTSFTNRIVDIKHFCHKRGFD